MNAPQSLFDRVARLRQLQQSRGGAVLGQVAPLPGEWPAGSEAFLASPAQSRLWFLHQLDPELTAYHLPLLCRLSGALDLQALQRALAGLIERHPSLRTSFRLHQGEVVQLIHSPASFSLQAEPLGAASAEAVIENWLHLERSTPFDLSAGLLLRARLLNLSRGEHLLLINHHHIASDGWSRSLLARDLTELYNAHHSGRTPALQPLLFHYQDYAAWQRQRLSHARLQQLRDYWIPQLTGLDPLELPCDYPRPASPSHQGASVAFRIEPDLLVRFEAFCRGEGATLQMGLLALLSLLLHRYSGQDVFVIGIPIWSRNHPDLEPLIGLFINTLPIRTHLSAEITFRQLLAQVKSTSIAAYEHQELPFEQMVEGLNLERDTSRNPLLQVMLQLTELPEVSLSNLDDLDVEMLEVGTDAAKFDLEFILRRESSGGINAHIVYASELFSVDRIERLAAHLQTLLANALRAADAPAVALGMLPEAERELIESWQNGPNIVVPDLCLPQLFELQVECAPDAVALIFEDQELTYADLSARANKLAHYLVERGVGADDVVAVCLEHSIELIVFIMAILKAGGCYLPLDPAWPEPRINAILEQAGDPPVLVCNGHRGSHRFDQRRLLIADTIAAIDRDVEPVSLACLDQSAYLLFTSGSTGKPKGVVVGHKALAARCRALTALLPLGIGDRILAHTTATFDISILELLIPLTHGAAIVVAPPATRKDFSAIIRHCQSNRVNLLQATPSGLEALLHSGYSPDRAMTIIAGGEALPQALARQLTRSGATLINAYGPSEATIYASFARLGFCDAVSIGRPLPGTVAYILDSSGGLCPIGVPGELHIGGDGLAVGYFSNPELTTEKFILDPFSVDPSARLYRSGDLASWNSDGSLAFHGRIDQQIKLRGFRIEPAEIEATLFAHPAVSQAVVVLRHDDPANPRLIAYWVPSQRHSSAGPHPGGLASADQLRAFLAERLPDYMVPAAFVALEALPLTSNGKLDRRALPAPSFAGDREQRVPASTNLEQQLQAIWVEVLDHSDFGITDNFFAIGGHSLAAARLVARIEQVFGTAPSLATFFQNPCIAGLAGQLLGPGSGQDHPSPAAEPIPRAEPLAGDWPEHCLAFPSSSSQSRLWFLHQLQPNLTAYHLPALWRLIGELDHAALVQALGDLVSRHPTLRTSFQLQASEVVQIVHQPAPFHLEVERLAERDPEQVIPAWQQADAATPFDLASGLLLRARLLQVADDQHLLLLNHHHIASDGWSIAVLAHDLTALYNARRRGEIPQLPPLGVHYQDYAAWQRHRLSGRHLQNLHDYWIPQLRALQPLTLPTDHPRPATPSHQGASLSFQIEPTLLAPLEELCRSEGATLQMGLLTIFALLLHRYSGQADFAIGIPIWGRHHPDFESLIGLFINTLPLRIRCSPDLSFRQLLAQVKTTSIGAYDHQEFPFEQMVEALELERDTSRNPLAQVMFQLIELPPPALGNLDGLVVESLAVTADTAKLDLACALRRTADQGLEGSISYATDLFPADRMERLITHLRCLISSAASAPDGPTGVLTLLPEAERRRLESWEQGPRIDLPDIGVHQLFAQQVESTPDAIALVFDQQQLTYAELNARADQLADHLMALGVGAEVIVAVCLERSIELVVGLLAILKAGGAYLPLDPAWPDGRQQLLLQEAGCQVLINAQGARVLHAVPPAPRAVASGSPLAYVAYTSGSTGRPKGVAIAHASILRLVHPVNGFRLAAGSVVLHLAPIAFDAATFELWGPLLNGGTVVVAPPGQISMPILADLLRQHGITTLWLTAGLFHAMVDAELQALAGVAQVLAGGDVLSSEHVQRFLDACPPGHELINGYGPTENTTFTCCLRMQASAPVHASGVSIGRPIAMSHVRVLDASGQRCPIGVPGELHIGGAGLARGYLHNPELTAASFIADSCCLDPLSEDPSARLYKSGDLVSWNADGTLAFHGRLDQQIKLRGFRIEPGEVEATLLTHPAVAQAVVVLHNSDPANPRLIAYWVAEQAGASASSDALRAFLSERLPAFMVPSAHVQLETLPLTANGKIDRKALPEPSFSGDRAHRVEPTGRLARQLHAIWAEVLGHSDFGITDNFFAVGGHSLAAARLVARVEQSIGSAPALAALFQNPTIAGLVRLMQGAVSALSPSLVTLQPKGERPPLFVIHGWGGTVWGFVDLARALAPDRPVYGLQAPGAERQLPPQGSVREMAAVYAEQILQMRPEGMIHLVGYSAGGWYAHAVAEALLQRGAAVGLFAVMDTNATARIHRRIGMRLLLQRLYSRLGFSVAGLLNPSGEQSRLRYLRGRIRALNGLLDRYLHVGADRSAPHAKTAAIPRTRDPFALLPKHDYRPERLPIEVDIFAPAANLPGLRPLWRFYARAGVRLHPMFFDHHDFYKPELMDELAAALESALKRLETPSM